MSDLSPPNVRDRARRSETLTGTVDVDFPEFFAPPPEPMGLLASWLEAAVAHGVREPRALALATADARGRASSRIVAINSVSDSGIVFITHADSQKGRELAENPWASGVLYWRETSQQITLAGPVRRLSDAEAETLWSARPVFTHAMTAVSRQSRPLDDLDHFTELRAKALQLGEPARPLPRPESFVGYRLEPAAVEFWANGTDRLHERLRYDRAGCGWEISRLQP
ncbi:phenazine biosynthesis FMN-dependent oxidase PhzG [Streptomyces sp. NL15-2K]|uniref:phenazine biosynthesis FMN-dependent oxidase PhzG n=1 Tax=Streptomyces sp. NL15-2K TaxID=376149 RepID=UPI000F570295|nr:MULTISPECIES: phenazine biosynthesis FMN-dependent oxidase PhzG [Actinomycetes]WKX13931.1 phenazine biosynthesis FMN-dependent oxidase PhzG [Kutzneria buriramensis]GCB50881.1 pyridoxamine 5'-phosphate oxidase [Streptomyces sp. NL15-2K]